MAFAARRGNKTGLNNTLEFTARSVPKLRVGVGQRDESFGKRCDAMGKGKRLRAERRGRESEFQDHAQELLTRNFQSEIRNSDLWPPCAKMAPNSPSGW